MDRIVVPRGHPGEPEEDRRKLMLRKAYVTARRYGFTDDERHELSSIIIGVNSDSWGDLTVPQLHDLLCFLDGHAYISWILDQRA